VFNDIPDSLQVLQLLYVDALNGPFALSIQSSLCLIQFCLEVVPSSFVSVVHILAGQFVSELVDITLQLVLLDQGFLADSVFIVHLSLRLMSQH